jgi:hypothetical protein
MIIDIFYSAYPNCKSNIMELEVHHQQSFKPNTSLNLANKLNSLCIPTRYKIFPPSRKLVNGLGLRVWGTFMIQGLRFRSLGFRVEGFEVWGLGCKIGNLYCTHFSSGKIWAAMISFAPAIIR